MSKFIAIASLFVFLVTAASAQTQSAAKPVGVGETAPDFTLVDQHGRKVTLSEHKGKSPVVLVFYRGYW